MTDQVVDSWSAYDYPMLVAIAKRAEQSAADMDLPSDNVLNEVVTSAQADERYKFERALTRLDEHGYITTVSIGFGQRYPPYILSITERGLRAVGAWPNPESVADALLRQLEREANSIAATDPAKSQRLKEIAGFLATGAREVVVNIVSSIAKQAAGLR